MMKAYVGGLVLLLTLASATGDEQVQSGVVPPPPQLPPKVKDGEVLEPDITIIEQEDKTIQQYSVNGQVYMIEIIPSSGPPYYLLDLDGDGEMDVRKDSPEDIFVPQWVLFRW